MDRTALSAFYEETFSKIRTMTMAKNHDYAGQSADPFANLTACEALDVAPTEIGILVRILDKFMRIKNFVKVGVLKVVDEKIEDTCLDAANYFILLAAYIRARKTRNGALKMQVAGSLEELAARDARPKRRARSARKEQPERRTRVAGAA